MPIIKQLACCKTSKEKEYKTLKDGKKQFVESQLEHCNEQFGDARSSVLADLH